MIDIVETPEYSKWFKKLSDLHAKARIDIRIKRIQDGNLGDIKRINKNLSEIRIDYGPGYRIYVTWQDNVLVILLWGGSKSSQKRDIEKAKALIEKYLKAE
jgi:putative addiction module killer protein